MASAIEPPWPRRPSPGGPPNACGRPKCLPTLQLVHGDPKRKDTYKII
jgi:hypothetical protein